MEESRILAILQENYDDKIADIEFLRDSGGTFYIANSKEQKFLLKITKKAFQDTILQSVKVMCYLFENKFPVPAVIRTKSGTPILEISEKSSGNASKIVLWVSVMEIFIGAICCRQQMEGFI